MELLSNKENIEIMNNINKTVITVFTTSIKFLKASVFKKDLKIFASLKINNIERTVIKKPTKVME